MLRLVGPLIVCSLALANTPAIAQAGATPPPASGEEAARRTEGPEQPASAPSTASELCHTLEQAAAENGLPVDFFVRVIWQESRLMRRLSVPRAREGSPNSCRRPPAGTLSPTSRPKLAAAPTQFCCRVISDVARSERMTYR